MNRLKNHPNVIKLKGFYQDSECYYVVQVSYFFSSFESLQELAEGGELFNAIEKKKNYSEREAQKVVRTLVYTIAYCHDRGIVHRDLKPENILLASKFDDLNIKIADFGFAREVFLVFCERMKQSRANNQLTTSCGTPGYLAPEILRGLAYGTAVDMWSIGVITYILYAFFPFSSKSRLCGYSPFPSDNDSLLFRMSMRGEFTFHSPAWDNISKDAKDFISALLVVDPDHRATAKQVF